MMPRLVNYSGGAYTGGGTSDVAWNQTLSAIQSRLVIVGGAAREEGGEQNPEEPNVAYLTGATQYGVHVDPYGFGNSQEFGSGFFYWLNSMLPGAGTYNTGVNFKDSPKYAERHRGLSAEFVNVRQEAPYDMQRSVGVGGVPRSVTHTITTPNSLVVSIFAWRVGFAETWGGGMTPIVTNRGDNALGISIAYAIAQPGTISPSCNCTNPEDNALMSMVWRPAKDKGGFLLNMV